MKMPYPIVPPLSGRELLRNIYLVTEPHHRLGMRLMWWSMVTLILPFIYIMDWRRDRQRPVSRWWTFLAMLASLPWTPVVLGPCVATFIAGILLSL